MPLPVSIAVFRNDDDAADVCDVPISHMYLNPESCWGLRLRHVNIDEVVNDVASSPSYIMMHSLHRCPDFNNENNTLFRLQNPLTLFYVDQAYPHQVQFPVNDCICTLSNCHFDDQTISWSGGLLAMENSYSTSNVLVDLPVDNFSLTALVTAAYICYFCNRYANDVSQHLSLA